MYRFLVANPVMTVLRELRRNLGFLTEKEARLVYVEEAKDRIDLELRMRDLDHARRDFASYSGHGRAF